jgi:hypothetical protein
MSQFQPAANEYQLPARIQPEYWAAELQMRQPHAPWVLFTVDIRTGKRVDSPTTFDRPNGMSEWIVAQRGLSRDVWIMGPLTPTDQPRKEST